MILHTTEVSLASDYCLFVAFNNGEKGKVDLHRELTGPVFGPLLEAKLFATARHDPFLKTVVWDNGADFAPEFLLDLMHAQQQKAA